MTQRTYFGTDGIRGTVGYYPITPDFVLRLGFSFGQVLMKTRSEQRPTVLIGKDTRISGYMLESALEAGLTSAGVDVVLTGPLPTPGIAYLTRALRLTAGIVLSASHNPYPDNGIKFFSGKGTKLEDKLELLIEAELDKSLQGALPCVNSDQLGKVRRLDDAAGRYIEFCKSTFPSHLDLKGLKLVVDCANGAAYHIAPHVFHELGAQVVPIGNEPNGYNINEGCGATTLDLLRSQVSHHKANLGIALDGDADRLMMVDEYGQVFDGDSLLFILVKSYQQTKPVAGVVGTLMTNFGLEEALGRLSVPFARAKVGDRHVLEMLLSKGWELGGENSGHLLHLGKHTTGDGIISCLQILDYLQGSKLTLSQATADLSLYPQHLVNVPLNVSGGKTIDWQTHAPFLAAQQAVQKELSTHGRILVRPSGTEPLLRIMVEAPDKDRAKKMAERLVQSLQH